MLHKTTFFVAVFLAVNLRAVTSTTDSNNSYSSDIEGHYTSNTSTFQDTYELQEKNNHGSNPRSSIPRRSIAPVVGDSPTRCMANTNKDKVLTSDGRDAKEARDNLFSHVVIFTSPIICVRVNELGDLIPFDTFQEKGFRKKEVILRLSPNADYKALVAKISGQGNIRPGKPVDVFMPITHVADERKLCSFLSSFKGVTGCVGNYLPE